MGVLKLKRNKPKAKRMKIKTGLIVILVMIALLCLIFFLGSLLLNITKKEKGPIITNKVIMNELIDISELSTVSFNYHGALRREEGSIKFITQKSFVMLYDTEVKLGINMEKAKIEVDDRQVVILLPPAEILSLAIDVNSLEFYDESSALFNWESKKDAVSSLQAAEADSRDKINQSELLDQAYDRAETLIREILEDILDTYSVEHYAITITKLDTK